MGCPWAIKADDQVLRSFRSAKDKLAGLSIQPAWPGHAGYPDGPKIYEEQQRPTKNAHAFSVAVDPACQGQIGLGSVGVLPSLPLSERRDGVVFIRGRFQ